MIEKDGSLAGNEARLREARSRIRSMMGDALCHLEISIDVKGEADL